MDTWHREETYRQQYYKAIGNYPPNDAALIEFIKATSMASIAESIEAIEISLQELSYSAENQKGQLSDIIDSLERIALSLKEYGEGR